MLTEAPVYMRRHQGAKFENFDVSNVIYQKFSHAPLPIGSMGKNVNVMLKLTIKSFCYAAVTLFSPTERVVFN